MSVEALTWAFSQELKPAVRKLVLIALADYANYELCAYPSIKALTIKTSLNRKTVCSALSQLVQMGYLLDTGNRVGATKQVIVYKLNGVPSHLESQYHYVYRLTHPTTGEFYVGCRSSYEDPEIDKYMGSGIWAMAMRKKGVPLTKEIVATFGTRVEANAYELQVICKLIIDPLCRNQQTLPKTVFFNSPVNGTLQAGKSPIYGSKESHIRDTEPPKEPSEDVKDYSSTTAKNGKKEKSKEPKNPDQPILIEQWVTLFKTHHGRPPAFKQADAVSASRLLKVASVEEILDVSTKAWSRPTGFNCKLAATLSGLYARWDNIRAELDLPPIVPRGTKVEPNYEKASW